MQRLGGTRRAGLICLAAAGIVLAATPALAAGDPVRGRALAKSCGECHGTSQRAPLAGMPYIDGQTAQFVELQLILMREGLREVPQMTPFLKGLSDGDIRDLGAHFAGKTPPRNLTKPDPSRYERGAALAKAMICGNCHGEDFRGQQHLPRLASQRQDYLIASLKAYRDNQRTGIDTSMNELMNGVTDSDIEDLAHFLAHQ